MTEDFEAKREDGLVLKINEDKKEDFAKSVLALDRDPGSYIEDAPAIIFAVKEAAVMFYTSHNESLVHTKLWDSYLEKVGSNELSRHIDKLAGMSDIHKTVYHVLACYITENKFGKYVNPEELVPEQPKPEKAPEPVRLGANAVERLKQLEKERAGLVPDPDAAAVSYRGKR